jgi:ribose 5-phosphate isomerase A
VRQLAGTLGARAGIVEHGLFIDLATDLIVAGPGGIQVTARAASDTAMLVSA